MNDRMKRITVLLIVVLTLTTISPALCSHRADLAIERIHEQVWDSSQRISIALEALHEKIFQNMTRLSMRIEGLHDKIENPEAYE